MFAQLESILGVLVGNSDLVPVPRSLEVRKLSAQGGKARTRALVFSLLLVQDLAVCITQL